MVHRPRSLLPGPSMTQTQHPALSRVLDIVRQSGELIREHWQRPRDVRLKGRIDLVTDTDVAVERFLKAQLADVVPGATFMAEESAITTAPDSLCWIIDPVDGTTNFAHGVPLVATSVGLWRDGAMELGVVNMPILHECFWAVRGQGAYCNGTRLHVTATDDMESALVATGFPYTVREDVDEVLAMLRKALLASRGVRRCGAAAIDMAYVAAGRYDAYYERGIKPWDTAAGWLLVEEAGGRVSRFDGSPYGLEEDIVVTNGLLHEAALQLVEPGKR